eukprot:m.78936 g.78936  ORF g.78936 m.78936 type:complete len:473 (+) comp9259_c0_seq1:75-1493(+)
MSTLYTTSHPKENVGQSRKKHRIDKDAFVDHWDVAASATDTSALFAAMQQSPLTSSDNITGLGSAQSLLSDVMLPSPPVPRPHVHVTSTQDKLSSGESVASEHEIRSDLTAECLTPQWRTNDFEMCHKVIGANMEEVEVTFSPRFDKGFRYSVVDDAYIGQKKNHFQVSYSLQTHQPMRYVVTTSGLLQIDGFVLSLYGIRCEEPSRRVSLEQSQSNRNRNEFHGVEFSVTDCYTYGTVQRLHFSEPTGNNQRRQGQPHPFQKYFFLAATVSAQCHEGDQPQTFPIASLLSDRLIVRASNPRSFSTSSGDTGLEDTLGGLRGGGYWRRETDGSISRSGRVIVQNGSHSRALEVTGDVTVEGGVNVKPRSTAILSPVDPAECLHRTASFRIGQSATPCDGPVTRGGSERHVLGAVGSDHMAQAIDIHQVLLDTVGATQELDRRMAQALSRVTELEKEVARLKAEKGSGSKRSP